MMIPIDILRQCINDNPHDDIWALIDKAAEAEKQRYGNEMWDKALEWAAQNAEIEKVKRNKVEETSVFFETIDGTSYFVNKQSILKGKIE